MQKPATAMRISDWSSDVCSSDLTVDHAGEFFSLSSVSIRPAPPAPVPVVVCGRSTAAVHRAGRFGDGWLGIWVSPERFAAATSEAEAEAAEAGRGEVDWQHGMTVWCGVADDRSSATEAVSRAMEGVYGLPFERFARYRSEEHTSELQSLMRISYAVFCLKKQ